ncbi:MAG: ribonuclease P protein component [Actinomycetota bacterium]
MIGRIPRRVGFTPFRKGRVVRDECFSLRFVTDGAAGGVRVAFSTPKRIGSAVVRNRLRRQVRELMRARADRLPSGWYLIGIEHPAVDNDWGQLGMALDHLLNRVLNGPRSSGNPTAHNTVESL